MRMTTISLARSISILAVVMAACSTGDSGSSSSAADEVGEPDTDAYDNSEDEGADGHGETGDGGGDGDGDGDGDGSDSDDPANAYCEPVEIWDEGWTSYELQIVSLINAARIAGHDCGEAGVFAPAPELLADPSLVCAARRHSNDMAENDYFDHADLDGNEPDWRFGEAGFGGQLWGQIIGAGYPIPGDAVNGWLASDLHCAKILDPSYTSVGAGYTFGPKSTYAHYWTLALGGE